MADVLGQVAQVDAEPDHRRLVRHVGDAVDRPFGDRGIAQVAVDPLRGWVEVRGALAVRGRQQRVDDAHVVPPLQQEIDHVRADESGAAGDEDRVAHGRPEYADVIRL